MLYSTKGKEFNSDIELPIAYNPDDNLKLLGSKNVHFFSVTLINSGTGIISINNTKHVIFAPLLLCLNERDFLLIENVIKIEAMSFYFTPKIINSRFTYDNLKHPSNDFCQTDIFDSFLLDSFINDNPVIAMGPESKHRLDIMFDKLAKELCLQSEKYWPCKSRACLIELLFYIYNLSAQPHSNIFGDLKLETDRKTYEIISFLNTNYNKNIRIKDLTDCFAINRTTLSCNFKKKVGSSIIEYITRIRMYLSSIMLRDSILTVDEIMYRVGYNNHTNYSRHFKKYFCCTPSYYREKYSSILIRQN